MTWWSCWIFGYFEKIGLALRILDVALDRHQAFLAHLGQDLVEHGQQVDVERLVENCEPLSRLGRAFSVALMALLPLEAMNPPIVRPTIARYSSGTNKAARLPCTA
jgi:hypothetical protein